MYDMCDDVGASERMDGNWTQFLWIYAMERQWNALFNAKCNVQRDENAT